jgi:hypothetical protein
MRHTSVPLTFDAFDVLTVEGKNVMGLPYTKRRAILDSLGLNDHYWRTPEAFDDGAALREAVCEHELEGVVAKRRSGRYLPGYRGWVKTKNRDYWRWELEREGVLKAPATIRLGQASRVYISAWPMRTLPRCAISAQLDDICHRVPTRRDLRPVPSTHR